MSALTLRAHDGGAALVVPVLDDAVLADGLDEGADVEVAHQHLVVARAVQARLVRHDLLALRVVLELVVAACNISELVNQYTQYEDSGTVTVGRYQNSGAKTGTLDIKISARWDSSSLVSCSMLVRRLLGLEVPSLSIERF